MATPDSPAPTRTRHAPTGDAAPYRPQHRVRLVTAASLFDGHDAAINVMRRILQASGAEVIHLGHNRAVREIVDCAIQEDVQGVAITSYQGGHVEFFTYLRQLLRERGAEIRVVGGGGGTILPGEIADLHAAGVDRLYSPDDGRAMGLQGMIDDVLRRCDFPVATGPIERWIERLPRRDPGAIARCISFAEHRPEAFAAVRGEIERLRGGRTTPVLGITGTGGSGKSSLSDEFVRRFLAEFPDRTVAIVAVDPSRRKSGGALLGDRIRMNAIDTPRVYMRSMATREADVSLSPHVGDAIAVCRAAGFDLIVLETAGVGQSDTAVTRHADVSVYVMTPEYGAASQLEKIDMLDFADVVAINKFDKPGALDALRDVRKQVRRNRREFGGPDETLPVFGTIASTFADPGTDAWTARVLQALAQKTGAPFRPSAAVAAVASRPLHVIPPARVRYLAEIVEGNERYGADVDAQVAAARLCYQLHGTIRALRGAPPAGAVASDPLPELAAAPGDPPAVADLLGRYRAALAGLSPRSVAWLRGWPALERRYAADTFAYRVRDKAIAQELSTESLAHLRIPKVSLPRYADWGDLLRWGLTENVPGEFPYSAGVFPLKREGEDPGRMFAGEGGPERTNRRFHYLSRGMPARRLSTAFDSVTLYGEDPAERPDIYGKIGNSGVSVATLDDAKKLYSGFDLVDPATSVSMTINGPAPMVLAFFLNAAIDQQCERWLRAEGRLAEVEALIAERYATRGMPRPRYQGPLPEGHDGLGLALLGVSGDEVLPADVYARIAADTLSRVRGTVQADILKEDQAQNTCIFSTEFAMRMMGDIQAWFIERDVRNFYSVSISGYHIAEAGANPITQLAFTLANGFTFVEYYLARGMAVDDFAPNLSFFFSNGLDPEYAVIGRVARRIWAKAMRDRYGANERSQKLKYHIQTSGRSLHAQEIAFNDIRTTLQALYALTDNCNSLHTNAYDEAITTPTEESVRRAMAIQLVINRELGLAKNENPWQGSFFVEDLTDRVERAVCEEFQRLSERGGVLGAMERMYQRTKIQEESLYYESLKHSGALPVIGVNTFLDSRGSPTIVPREVIRSTAEEKDAAIRGVAAVRARNTDRSAAALAELQETARAGANLFGTLMRTVRVCTLGEISRALYEVGGQYRRAM